MGEGLSLGESGNTIFVLTRVGPWVGKPGYLAIDPLTIQEGQQEITWAITECQIKAIWPGHPHVNPSIPQPFRFNHPGDSLKRTPLEMPIQTINYCLASDRPELQSM